MQDAALHGAQQQQSTRRGLLPAKETLNLGCLYRNLYYYYKYLLFGGFFCFQAPQAGLGLKAGSGWRGHEDAGWPRSKEPFVLHTSKSC